MKIHLVKEKLPFLDDFNIKYTVVSKSNDNIVHVEFDESEINSFGHAMVAYGASLYAPILNTNRVA